MGFVPINLMECDLGRVRTGERRISGRERIWETNHLLLAYGAEQLRARGGTGLHRGVETDVGHEIVWQPRQRARWCRGGYSAQVL